MNNSAKPFFWMLFCTCSLYSFWNSKQ